MLEKAINLNIQSWTGLKNGLNCNLNINSYEILPQQSYTLANILVWEHIPLFYWTSLTLSHSLVQGDSNKPQSATSDETLVSLWQYTSGSCKIMMSTTMILTYFLHILKIKCQCLLIPCLTLHPDRIFYLE